MDEHPRLNGTTKWPCLKRGSQLDEPQGQLWHNIIVRLYCHSTWESNNLLRTRKVSSPYLIVPRSTGTAQVLGHWIEILVSELSLNYANI